MEEKRPGQTPEADRQPDDPRQNRTARPGGQAKDGLEPTERDRALVREADARSAASTDALAADGFGDHKGVDGFPAPDRKD